MIETASLRRKLLELAIAGKLVPRTGEWKTVRLGDVAEVELGKRVCKKTDSGKPYKFLANINVRWGGFDLTCLKETLFDEKEAKQFSLKKGDLLVCEGGVPGRCAIWDKDETDIKYQMALHRIRPSEVLSASFLRYYLEAVHKKQVFTQHFIGCTISHLTKEILVKMEIPLPPLAEQKAIVKRLEELLALEREIAADNAALDDLISAAKSKILQLAVSGKLIMHGNTTLTKLASAEWTTVSIEAACVEFCDGDWIESKDQAEDGIRLVQTGNVGELEFLDKDTRAKYISQDTFQRLHCTEIKAGDILISRLPDPVGRACIIPKKNQRMITAVDCAIVRLKDSILPQYFLYYTASPQYYSEVNKHLSGTTRKRISRGNLGKIGIPLPPLAEQKAIVAKVDELFSVLDAMKGNQR